ncbi:subtilisin-like protein, partial [Coemansia reversa NRRL 1564]
MPISARTAEPRSEFPTHGMLPKGDSQAADFLRKHPDYDGRGVVVAVLDTGIDPGAKGLQMTSDGKRKVIDYIDCSGSGDVALGKPQKCSGDTLELRAGSGRMLRLNPSWTNPSGEWRLGTRRLYEVAPPVAKMNILEEREAQFRKDAQRLVDSVNACKDSGSDGSGADERAEADSQANVLDKLGSAYSDPGPVLDCVVFHDGQQWRAAIDVAESGDLSETSAMGAYKSTSDVGLLSRRHLLYYTLNFYDDGRTLSIVTSVGEHGSHVAGIIAANHPEEPENNGVAPGAQLLSLTISKQIRNGMETGIGLTRAVKAIVEYGVDMANISFGEPTDTPNRGQWVQMVRREVVRHRRCIFVGSVGNGGPALSTVTAPGGTTEDFIGVGAYVGYDQMKANHGMYETVNDTVFTWSSRGPTLDGARGVDIYAPGSAIASYPAYTKQRLQVASGTSMSAPSLCGCLALLVSAWKQEFGCDSETQRISPYRVKNAILNTAKSICDELGTGMIQTDAAWQFLKAHVERDFEDLTYTVRVLDSGDARGIYLRNFEESAHVRHMQIQITPEFPGDVRAKFEHDSDGSYGQQEGQRRFDFEQRALLIATASWVRAPEAVYVGGNGCSFSVRIDPTLLKPGQLHVAAIDAYDSTNVDRGPIFSIPITVTKPLPVELSGSVELGCLRFQPTEIVRRFIAVPVGATKAQITIHATNAAAQESAPATFYLHCLQLVPQERFRAYIMKQRVTIGHQTYVAGGGTAEQKSTSHMDVTGGATLEVCIAPYWSQHGTREMDVCIEFNGIVPANTGCLHPGGNQLDTGVVINGNQTVARADFMALIRPEYNISPVAKLDTLRIAKRPVKAVISPTESERDTHLMTESAIYRLVLDYKFETKTNNVRVRPRIPAVDSKIYESWADDFGLAIFDANKRCVVSNNSYTESTLLEKTGDYLVRVMIRHRNSKDLEALKSMALVLDISL